MKLPGRVVGDIAFENILCMRVLELLSLWLVEVYVAEIHERTEIQEIHLSMCLDLDLEGFC